MRSTSVKLNMDLYTLWLLLIVSFLTTVNGQDCKVSGKRCADHEQCCGGCCFDGYCIDTYRSCLEGLNVCKDHICMGEENCVAYQPPRCLGCEPIPVCRLTND